VNSHIAEPKPDPIPAKKKIKVLLPIGLPGMGKSTFENQLRSFCQ
jgi:putative ribosome biogenesis GTPase RsgA